MISQLMRFALLPMLGLALLAGCGQGDEGSTKAPEASPETTPTQTREAPELATTKEKPIAKERLMIETAHVDLTGLDPENVMFLDVSTGGRVVIEMFPDKAPQHVARFKELARRNFYDGIVFHRVIEGFMAQTGDPTGTGTGGSGQNIKAEFNDIKHLRGVVSTARAMDPDSADSQFFIMLGDAPHLDGQYTAWGRVVSGMDYIDKIKKGPANEGGVVAEPRDSIVAMRVAADVLENGE